VTAYEYKVVPAPKKGLRGKGIKGTDAKFANALMHVMNTLGADGWEYQRTDTLPCEERRGLTGKTTVFQNLLVFRRELTTMKQEDMAIQGDGASEIKTPPIEDDAPLKLAKPALVGEAGDGGSDQTEAEDQDREPVRLVTKLQEMSDKKESASAS
jgi:hypothetical protein